ncbi:MAG: right-handed parallel beta-helix repeat-containing protein [Bacteriovoracaceae bacterium]|nr:right-handed parallel beta-helix repeat-containing protein [Bacteriovoracaceae bacterium]
MHYFLLSLITFCFTLFSYATTFTVTSSADSGPGTLRQAILDANVLISPPHTILFGQSMTIDLQSDLPEITQSITIDGQRTNQHNIVINAGTISFMSFAGLSLKADNCIIKDLEIKGSNNIITMGSPGIYIDSSHNLIIGNHLHNNGMGITIEDQAEDNQIGGLSLTERNFIYGNVTHGIDVHHCPNLIQNNEITSGTDDFGNPLQQNGINIIPFNTNASGCEISGGNVISRNLKDGIFASAGQNVLITGNILEANGSSGILITHTAQGFKISQNSIFDNTALGIDLSSNPSALEDGVTSNDSNDADVGANGLQNFLSSIAASSGNGQTQVDISFNGIPSENFTAEFFSHTLTELDSSDHGEGKTFLGTATFVTDATGNYQGTHNLSIPTAIGDYVTATVTNNTTHETSEFSESVPVTPVGTVELVTAEKINLFPNPTSSGSIIHLSTLPHGKSSLHLIDFNGRKILSKEISARHIELQLPTLSSGLYFISIENAKKKQTLKLVIE